MREGLERRTLKFLGYLLLARHLKYIISFNAYHNHVGSEDEKTEAQSGYNLFKVIRLEKACECSIMVRKSNANLDSNPSYLDDCKEVTQPASFSFPTCKMGPQFL